MEGTQLAVPESGYPFVVGEALLQLPEQAFLSPGVTVGNGDATAGYMTSQFDDLCGGSARISSRLSIGWTVP